MVAPILRLITTTLRRLRMMVAAPIPFTVAQIHPRVITTPLRMSIMAVARLRVQDLLLRIVQLPTRVGVRVGLRLEVATPATVHGAVGVAVQLQLRRFPGITAMPVRRPMPAASPIPAL